MLRPPILLMLLSIGATVLGAKLYVDRALHSEQSSPSAPGPDETSLDYIQALEEELDRLNADNTALRQLIENDGSIHLAPELITFVEKGLEVEFKDAPLAFTGSQDALREASGQVWLSAFSEQQLEILSYSFDVLGIIPPEQQWIGQLIAAETTGSRGVYDPSTGEIVLSEDFDEENIHHQAALTRLLAIALLDQHYPLQESPTFDHFIAHRALHHGRASILQDRFYTLQAKHIGFITERSPNTEAAELFAVLPVLVQDITTFANIYGKDYLNGIPAKADIQNALNSNIASTRDILLKNYPFKETLPPNKLQDGDHTEQLSTQLGALTLKSYLSQLSSAVVPPEEWLKSLRSDKLSVTTEASKNAHTSWTIDFSNDSITSKFHQWAKSQQQTSTLSILQSSSEVKISHTQPLQGE